MGKENYIVLTGAPGTGKSSVLELLEKDGYRTVAEPAREILAEQRRIGGRGVSEINDELFRDLILSRSIRKYQENLKEKNLVFFDRGVLDCAAYSELFGLSPEIDIRAGKEFRTNTKVFIAPRWREIYANDEERKMSFAATEAFDAGLKRHYLESSGYQLIDLPLLSPGERVSFTKKKLDV